jgi:argininosuccinate lyase
MTATKPWGGRFSEPTHQLVEQFTQSVNIDSRLYKYDIMGSIAHARMLERSGILSASECEAIVAGLRAIETDIASGAFSWSRELEDVHMNIEAALTARIGDPGKKLHTARSRNDQVATDMRLYLRDAVDEQIGLLSELQGVLLDIAEREADTPMPGVTHLQVAQPVTFGHHMMAWFHMLDRDRQRLSDARRRINISPLGAAALAGTSFPIDREFTARELGFDGPAENSLDAVSDRDFVMEYCSHAAILAVHLSRMAEELVLWASERYRFIEIGDAFCTGSSIMPQKKNPDVAELLRGKSGGVIGNLVSMLVLMKGQPLAYNRDNQEDKAPLLGTVDAVSGSVRIVSAMLPTMTLDRERMRDAVEHGFATATDLAEYLVGKGIPFRDAHEIVGKSVRYCIDSDLRLCDLSLEQFRAFSPAIEDDVYSVLSVEGSIRARDHIGGTSPAQVRSAVSRARERLGKGK